MFGVHDASLGFRTNNSIAVILCRRTDSNLTADRIEKNLNIIIRSKLTNNSGAKLNTLMPKYSMRFAWVVEELGSGDFETA